MMRSIRGVLRRNRGVVAALGCVAVFLAASSWLLSDRPRVSWTESYSTIPPVKRFGGDDTDVVVPMTEAKFSPDGRTLLTYDSARARFRDLATGETSDISLGDRKASFDFPGLDLLGMEFLDGGRCLLGIFQQDSLSLHHPVLKVWEVPTWREFANFSKVGDGSSWPGYEVSGDGSTLAFISGPPGPRTVGLWKNVPDWQIRYFRGSGPISLSFDGRKLAVVEKNGLSKRLAFWDVESSENLGSIPLEVPTLLESIAFSPDGKLLAEIRLNQALIWDVTTLSRRCSLDLDPSGKAWFSPDGSLFSVRPTYGFGQPDQFWNLAKDPPRQIFKGSILELSRDGRYLIQDGPNLVGSPIPPRPMNFPRLVEMPSMRVLVSPIQRLGSPLSSVLEGPILIPPAAFSSDGRSVALKIDRFDSALYLMLTRWLPMGVTRWLKQPQIDHELQILDCKSGRTLESVDLPDPDLNLSRFALLDGGKTLALRYLIKDGSTESDVVELWDVPGPPSRWPWLEALALVGLAGGRWYDIRSRRRVITALA